MQTIHCSQKKLAAPPRWEDILQVKANTIQLSQPVMLDFGAAGKGYLVDIITKIIQKYDVAGFCVDAGGDMRYGATQQTPLRVGLEHPDNPTQVIGVAELHNQSLCGSAGNRRKWAQYHHIIDPHLLASPTQMKAVWVVAPTTMHADGLATALFFVPPERLRHFAMEYVIVYADNSAQVSRHFPGQLFGS